MRGWPESAKSAAMKVLCKHDEMLPVTKLLKLRNPANPNRHSGDQIQLYAKILETQGWRRPVVLSKLSGLMVSGHGALEAAVVLGWKTCPVERQDFENAALELAHMSADNELARLSETDPNSQEALLRSLEGAGFDRELAGLLADIAEPVRLERIAITPPPAMTWVLMGIPTVDFGLINEHVEKARAVPGAIVETTVSSADEG